MALFHVHRYVCAEETSRNDKKTASPQNILTKLHEKALARKRKLESHVISDDQEPIQKKHAKGRATSENTGTLIPTEAQKQVTQEKTKKKRNKDRKLPSEVILKRLTAKAKAREKALLNESTEKISEPLHDHSESPKTAKKAKKLLSEPQETPHSKNSALSSYETSEVNDLSSKKKKVKVENEIAQNTTPNWTTLSKSQDTSRTVIGSSNRPIKKESSEVTSTVELETPRLIGKHKKMRTVSDSSPDEQNNEHKDTELHLKSSAKKKDEKKLKGSPSKPSQIVQNNDEQILFPEKSEISSVTGKTPKKRKSTDDVKIEKRPRLSPKGEGTTVNFEKASLNSNSETMVVRKKGRKVSTDTISNDENGCHGNKIPNLDSDEKELKGRTQKYCNRTLSDNECIVGETTDDTDKQLNEDRGDSELEEGQRAIVHGDGDEDVGTAPIIKEEDTEEKAFAVLGGEKTTKKQKVSRVLPDWLANPTLIEHDLKKYSVSVEEMSQLDPRLVRSLQRDGISLLFPVQRHVIPAILESVQLGIHAGEAGYRPRDLCVSAPTGSGKTLAFALPVIQALLDRVVPRIRALVVLPTRDLAQQVYKVFVSLCEGSGLRPALVGGLKKFTQEQRMLVETSNGETQCDIIVATPGRLVDHINKTRGFTLQHLRFLVIDEADRMMEQISQDWIAQVEKCVFTGNRPAPRPVTVANCATFNMPLQKLLFSATLSQNPEKLTQLNLFRPRLMTSVVASKKTSQQSGEQLQADRGEFIGKYTTPVGLTEYYISCTPGEKPLVILHLVRSQQLGQILCFANTIQATHRLYHLIRLVGGVEVAEFSSNQTAGQRRQILKQFKSGKIQLLICSDAMARGMDVQNAKYVISYDMPPYVKTYIHRVGRTARAGKSGVAFSLLQKHEVPRLLKMLKHAGKININRHPTKTQDLEYLVEAYENALQKLPGILKKEKSYN